jgi:hypothetical protein
VRRHPLIAFFVLAYLLTWWTYPLLTFSPLLGIPGLFGPALAAMIMAAVTDGSRVSRRCSAGSFFGGLDCVGT